MEDTPAPESGRIHLKNETIAAMPSCLVSRGFPLPPGRCQHAADVHVADSTGRPLPSASQVLQRRPDGSIEWVLIDFLCDLGPSQEMDVFVVPRRAETPLPRHPVTLVENVSGITLSNGITTLELGRSGDALVRELVFHGVTLISLADRFDLETIDLGGKIFRASLAHEVKLTVERANPMVAVVVAEGSHQARDGSRFLDFTLRFTLAADIADVKIEHTFHDRQPDEAVHFAKAIRLVATTRMDPSAKKRVRQQHHGQAYFPRPIDIAENAEIVSSSVNDLDRYRETFKPLRRGAVFLRNVGSLHENYGDYPPHMRPDQPTPFREEHGVGALRRVYPYVGWVTPQLSVAIGIERWDKLHPKSLHLDENTLTFSVWPDWATPCRLVQGAARTHTLWLTAQPRELGIDQIEQHYLRWEIGGLDPVAISIEPAWTRHCQAMEMHHLLEYQPHKYPFLENLIEVAPAAGNPSRFTYDRHGGTGMFNYGDIVSDGGATNNEDDVLVLFPLLDYLRTGNVYCFDYGRESARHYMEVDFCDFSTNRRQHGGLVAHTMNHFEGMAYPSHQWVEGILAYYYLTGEPRARRVVERVADHYVWWTRNLLDLIILDGREAGMPLVNLAAAHRLTGRQEYLDAAYTIIDSFHRPCFQKHGELRYPYPQGGHLPQGSNQKTIRGYGDWSSYHGLYRVWQQSGDDSIRQLLLGLLEVAMRPESFGVNDARSMDFFTAWIYMQLTGDTGLVDRLAHVIPMLLRRGGHPTRRLHFLKVLDERGLIDERLVGSRAGVI
jgi:hypothetical protein